MVYNVSGSSAYFKHGIIYQTGNKNKTQKKFKFGGKTTKKHHLFVKHVKYISKTANQKLNEFKRHISVWYTETQTKLGWHHNS